MATRLDQAESLEEALLARTARIGVIGLGYVGLPLVQAFVNAGFRTMGFDVDQQKVDQLRAGRSYIGHIASSLVRECVETGKFEPTADMRRLGEADAILICVPTPLSPSRDPDLTYVEQTAAQIGRSLRPGQLVVLESTTYPGTTRDVVLPMLATSGLRVEEDFYLAFSPEREDPGNKSYGTRTIPKVVGGIGPHSLRLAATLYGNVMQQVVSVSSAEIAEACKILENTYRSVNIAMVNELKMLFDRMGIDIWEVIEAAKTKPFGFQAFYPGPGLGGHCIPIDPFYLSWVARKYGMPTRFIELAGEINTQMPHYVVDRVSQALNEFGKPVKGSQICILGVAYKKDIDDPRESPSFELMQLLQERGADLSYSDPFVPRLPKMRSHPNLPAMTSTELTPEFLRSLDCVLIATDHSQFDYAEIVRHSALVVDTRNATRSVVEGQEKVRRA